MIVEGYLQDGRCVMRTHGGTVVETVAQRDDRLREEYEERVRRSAPDMLAALEWIVDIADKTYEQDEKLRSDAARQFKRISDKARAVIAKAKDAP